VSEIPISLGSRELPQVVTSSGVMRGIATWIRDSTNEKSSVVLHSEETAPKLTFSQIYESGWLKLVNGSF